MGSLWVTKVGAWGDRKFAEKWSPAVPPNAAVSNFRPQNTRKLPQCRRFAQAEKFTQADGFAQLPHMDRDRLVAGKISDLVPKA